MQCIYSFLEVRLRCWYSKRTASWYPFIMRSSHYSLMIDWLLSGSMCGYNPTGMDKDIGLQVAPKSTAVMIPSCCYLFVVCRTSDIHRPLYWTLVLVAVFALVNYRDEIWTSAADWVCFSPSDLKLVTAMAASATYHSVSEKEPLANNDDDEPKARWLKVPMSKTSALSVTENFVKKSNWFRSRKQRQLLEQMAQPQPLGGNIYRYMAALVNVATGPDPEANPDVTDAGCCCDFRKCCDTSWWRLTPGWAEIKWEMLGSGLMIQWFMMGFHGESVTGIDRQRLHGRLESE